MHNSTNKYVIDDNVYRQIAKLSLFVLTEYNNYKIKLDVYMYFNTSFYQVSFVKYPCQEEIDYGVLFYYLKSINASITQA